MIAWFADPPAPDEPAVVSLFVVATVVAVGVLEWHRPVAPVLAVAGCCGLGTRLIGTGWRPNWRAILVSTLIVSAGIGIAVSAGIFAAVEGHTWKQPQASIQPTGARPVIEISPCPTGTLVGPGPAGSYVCSVPIPPDPGGPTVASPNVR